MAQKYFDNPHGIWLRENRYKYGKTNSRERLRVEFNETFNFNTSFRQFRKLLCLFLPKQGRERNGFNDEELEWTKENYMNYDTRESFSKAFEDKFGSELNLSRFTNLFYKKLKINLGYIEEKKGYNNFNSIKFPIGHEMKIHNKTWVKVQSIPKARETMNYRPKAHLKYEEHYNVKINDKEQRVVNINGDVEDYSKDNLMLLSLEEFKTYTGKKNWYPSNRFNKYLLNVVKLEYIVKNEGE